MITPKKSDTFWKSDASEAGKLANKRNLNGLQMKLKKRRRRRRGTSCSTGTADAIGMTPPVTLHGCWKALPNTKFMPLVAGLFRDYDIGKRTPRVTTPVFLALGRYDYLVPYHTSDGRKDSFPKLSYKLFEKSGH